jgi:hypothetical protein
MARPRAASKRKPALKPITFVPVEQVFSPQVQVRATRDLNGWADRRKRIKWFIPGGTVGYLDAEKAREFHIKGYVEIVDGDVGQPASEDEVAEVMSTVTTIGLGPPNGA